MKNRELSQIVPVIRHGRQEIYLEQQQEDDQFLVFSKTISLDSDSIGAYTQQLKEQKEKKMLEQEETDIVIKNTTYWQLVGLN